MVRNMEEAKEKIRDLIKKFVHVVKANPGSVVVNADQMGMQKETHSTRTIARQGSRKVEMKAQSTNAMSHSLTVLPVVYFDGRQHPKMYVHLGEPSGTLPKKGCYQNPNMVVGVSKSHMMGTDAAIKFFKEVLFIPPMPKKMLLLLDSWPLFRNHSLIQSLVPSGHTVIILNIPPGGTCLAQPPDLEYNQQFKAIVRRVDDLVLMHDIKYDIKNRDNRLRLMSQIYWIFGAPIFKEYLKYGWYRGGYTDQHPDKFDTPPQFIFGSASDGDCACSKSGCVVCPYCCKAHCFGCFFVDSHRC
ncbi:hypothetical protein PENTCL1PPCAC_12602, partial [Pristionchus entomophagus]